MGQFFTGEDIRRLAKEDGCRHLLLAPDDRITPEAMDIARRLGMRVHREEELLGSLPPLQGQTPCEQPLSIVRADAFTLKPFPVDIGRPEMHIRLADVITGANGSPMAAGFMTWEKGSFPWTLNYDEIDFVVDGQLEIRKGSQVVVGNPGDVIHIPKGSEIFSARPASPGSFMSPSRRTGSRNSPREGDPANLSAKPKALETLKEAW